MWPESTKLHPRCLCYSSSGKLTIQNPELASTGPLLQSWACVAGAAPWTAILNLRGHLPAPSQSLACTSRSHQATSSIVRCTSKHIEVIESEAGAYPGGRDRSWGLRFCTGCPGWTRVASWTRFQFQWTVATWIQFLVSLYVCSARPTSRSLP